MKDLLWYLAGMATALWLWGASIQEGMNYLLQPLVETLERLPK